MRIQNLSGVVMMGAVLTLLSAFEEAPNPQASGPPATTPPASPPPRLKEVASPGAARDHAPVYRTDVTEIAVAARGDPSGKDKLEHMVRMKAGDPMVYTWEVVGGGEFWHEFHGHTEDAVTFYKKAGGTAHRGSLTAPFDGIHGWYFENRSDKAVTVRLRMSGFYERTPQDE